MIMLPRCCVSMKRTRWLANTKFITSLHAGSVVVHPELDRSSPEEATKKISDLEDGLENFEGILQAMDSDCSGSETYTKGGDTWILSWARENTSAPICNDGYILVVTVSEDDLLQECIFCALRMCLCISWRLYSCVSRVCACACACVRPCLHVLVLVYLYLGCDCGHRYPRPNCEMGNRDGERICGGPCSLGLVGKVIYVRFKSR